MASRDLTKPLSMPVHVRRGAAAALAAAMAVPILLATPARAGASTAAHPGAAGVAASSTRVLTQQTLHIPTMPNGKPAATYVGVLPGDTKMMIDVAVDTNLAAKEAAVRALYDPASPSYHQYFTSGTWQARFAVAQTTYDTVASRLTGAGMHVAYSDAARDLIELSATAAQVDAAFHVTEVQYRLAVNNHIFYVNDRAPTVPAAVDAVSGLTDVGFALKNTATDQGQCQPVPNRGTVCTGGFEGSELRTLYGVGSDALGRGQALAVWGYGDPEEPINDLHVYEAQRNLPQLATVYVNTDHTDCVASGPQASDCAPTNDVMEFEMDSQAANAMAPDAAAMYFFFANTLGGPSGIQAWADWDSTEFGPVPMQMDASFGGCESLGNDSLPVVAGDNVIVDAAAVDGVGKGKTLFVSAGDLGAGCVFAPPFQNGVTPGGPPQVQYPCSSPWVVCAGGTVMYTNGATDATEQRADLGGTCTPQTTVNQLNNCAELAWNYTGGGVSSFEAAPAWQQSLGFPIVGRCAADSQGNPVAPPGPICRGVPDVAALSGDITVGLEADGQGFEYHGDQGDHTWGGGTSLSAPLWEGMWADIQSSASPPLGFASPVLYGLAADPAKDSCAFYDVQLNETGTNYGYPAIPRTTQDPTGWDYDSGLGTPNVQCIEALLAQSPVSTPEAPAAPLLLLIPAAVAAGVARRRRRGAGSGKRSSS